MKDEKDWWEYVRLGDGVMRVLQAAAAYPTNTYLWHTKNPARAAQYLSLDPRLNSILCATIESNRDYAGTQAQPMAMRFAGLGLWYKRRMTTIEPVMDFDLADFVKEILALRPCQVNIGADSGHNSLLEPEPEKLLSLIEELRERNIKVHLKRKQKLTLNSETSEYIPRNAFRRFRLLEGIIQCF